MAAIIDTQVGSCWRKWDLHVHTPGTRLNDQFDKVDGDLDWDRFCRIVHESDVEVFGITDYFSFNSFYKFKGEYLERYPNSKKVFFPNLELRLDLAVHSSGKEINVHFLFPEDLKEADAKRFLSSLKTSIKRGRGTRQVALAELEDESEKVLRTVSVNFDQCMEALQETFDDTTAENHTNTAVVVFSGGTDGLSPGDMNGRKGVLIDNFDLQADAIFGNAKNAHHWLNAEARAAGTDRLIRPHPTFYGCDAHDFDGLEKMLGKSGRDQHRHWDTTWVKAEPTWNGLLQTLVEPDSRVRIQAMSPDEKPDFLVIDSVTFKDSDNFPQRVSLNPGLNAIIGSRSSGKSSLLAHIAYSVSPEDAVKQQRIAGQDVPGPAAGYRWEDVEDSYCSVSWRGDADSTGRVVYIPQNYLNQLSSNPEEVTARIEPAARKNNPQLFDKFDAVQRERKKKSEKIDGLVRDWFNLSAEIDRLKSELDNLPGFAALEKEAAKQRLLLPSLTASQDFNEEDVERLSTLREQFAALERKIEDREEKLISAEKLFAPEGTDLTAECVSIAVDLGRCDEFLNQTERDEVDRLIEQAESDIRKQLGAKLKAVIKRVEQEVTEDVKRSEEQNKSLTALESKFKNSVETAQVASTLDELKNRSQLRKRTEQSLELKVEERAQHESEIQDSLSDRVAIENQLVDFFNKNVKHFENRLTFELESGFAYERLEALSSSFNLRSVGSYLQNGVVEIEAAQAKAAQFLSGLRDGKIKLKKHTDPESLARAVLSMSPEFRFVATMDGDRIGGFNTSTMTPGKQALFALTLILSDFGEEWPLLIDQPEDDLDSKSIYQDVVQFLKKQKERRQILMVSHNANLVVGADAELVVVANRHGDDRPNKDGRTFDYVSGGLESSKQETQSRFELDRLGIREHVVEILDGGEEAFKKRQEKYKLPV